MKFRKRKQSLVVFISSVIFSFPFCNVNCFEYVCVCARVIMTTWEFAIFCCGLNSIKCSFWLLHVDFLFLIKKHISGTQCVPFSESACCVPIIVSLTLFAIFHFFFSLSLPFPNRSLFADIISCYESVLSRISKNNEHHNIHIVFFFISSFGLGIGIWPLLIYPNAV